MRRLFVSVCVAVACAVAVATLPAQSSPPSPLTLLSAQGRRSLPVVVVNGGEYLSLDELAAAFGLTVRDDRVTGATTVSTPARSAVLTPDRTVASVQGRLVSLAAPPVRQEGRLLVTPEFVTRVLAVVVDQRLEYRRAGRLLVLGDLRVPRVITRGEFGANAAQVTFEVSPATEATVTSAGGQITVTFAADAVDAAIPTVPAQGLLQAIRAADGAPTLTLVVGPRFASHRAATQAIDAGTSRLVIDLVAAGAESLTPAAPAPPPAAATATPPAAGAIDPASLPFDPPARGVRTVVIDPGPRRRRQRHRGAGRHAREERHAAGEPQGEGPHREPARPARGDDARRRPHARPGRARRHRQQQPRRPVRQHPRQCGRAVHGEGRRGLLPERRPRGSRSPASAAGPGPGVAAARGRHARHRTHLVGNGAAPAPRRFGRLGRVGGSRAQVARGDEPAAGATSAVPRAGRCQHAGGTRGDRLLVAIPRKRRRWRRARIRTAWPWPSSKPSTPSASGARSPRHDRPPLARHRSRRRRGARSGSGPLLGAGPPARLCPRPTPSRPHAWPSRRRPSARASPPPSTSWRKTA